MNNNASYIRILGTQLNTVLDVGLCFNTGRRVTIQSDLVKGLSGVQEISGKPLKSLGIMRRSPGNVKSPVLPLA